jgi:translation initiation factor 4E
MADNGTSEVVEEKVAATEEQQVEKQEPVPEGEHATESPWTLYFDKKLPKPANFKNYEKNLQKVGKFNTVEGFWRHFSYLKKPDDIPKGHNLFMFRNSLTPAWETFPKGGAWIIKVRKKNGVISRLWEELVFACVGELFECPDIVGVVLSVRSQQDLLSVWNGDNTNPEVRFKIGDKLREILNLDESTQVEYKPFKSAIRDGSSFRNAMPYVYAASGTQ